MKTSSLIKNLMLRKALLRLSIKIGKRDLRNIKSVNTSPIDPMIANYARVILNINLKHYKVSYRELNQITKGLTRYQKPSCATRVHRKRKK